MIVTIQKYFQLSKTISRMMLIFICFYRLVANFIYYEGAVQIPKSVANQNFYYNYCVLPNGLSEWQYWEFFYDQKENTRAPRELVITGDAGNLKKCWKQVIPVSFVAMCFVVEVL